MNKKNCKSCGKIMISSSSETCPSCREVESKRKLKEVKGEEKYIRKNATFNRLSKSHMEIWNWCLNETEDFKSQSFSDFIREKLEWCMEHEGDVR